MLCKKRSEGRKAVDVVQMSRGIFLKCSVDCQCTAEPQ
jgi:hypothetical protein